MMVAIIILGLILAVSGLVGCILPIIPGPPLSFIALIILSYAKNWEPFSATFLIIMGGLTVLVAILDYVIPAAGAKKYGASKFSVFCSIIGMMIGLFAFPPFGLFIGGFVGAVGGELYVGKAGEDALRAGLGVFVGNLVSIGLKMGLCGVMLLFYVKEMF
jgi:hypothetical protein